MADLSRLVSQTLPATERGTYRFSAEEYHKLGEVGILGEDDRIELLDGELTLMSPIGSPHFATVNALNMLFVQRLSGRCIVSPQNPVRLGPYSEPQPDVTLLKKVPHGYKEQLPAPDEVYLVVEVADSSLYHDRNKLKLYARAGIPEVWIVNLSQRRVEVYRQPAGERFADEQMFERGPFVAAFADVSFTVEEILP
jgi:hypothetical protein